MHTTIDGTPYDVTLYSGTNIVAVTWWGDEGQDVPSDQWFMGQARKYYGSGSVRLTRFSKGTARLSNTVTHRFIRTLTN